MGYGHMILLMYTLRFKIFFNIYMFEYLELKYFLKNTYTNILNKICPEKSFPNVVKILIFPLHYVVNILISYFHNNVD